MNKCVICGGVITKGRSDTEVCSEDCRKERNRRHYRAYYAKKREKILEAQMASRRGKKKRVKNVEEVMTFKNQWKKADKLARKAMIARWWRDNKDADFTYGKLQTLQYQKPTQYLTLYHEVLDANGIEVKDR